MRIPGLLRFCFSLALGVPAVVSAQGRDRTLDGAPYRDARLSPAARAQDLLARMSLEEEFLQLFLIPGDRDDAAHD